MTYLNHALIIDDDKFNLELLKYLLTVEGLSSTAVHDVNILDAVLAETARINVVFLDLEMPYMDGYMVYSLLRNQLGADMPIVACTGHMHQVSNVRELGFQGFISKPLDPKRFHEQVKAIVSGQQVWDY